MPDASLLVWLLSLYRESRVNVPEEDVVESVDPSEYRPLLSSDLSVARVVNFSRLRLLVRDEMSLFSRRANAEAEALTLASEPMTSPSGVPNFTFPVTLPLTPL